MTEHLADNLPPPELVHVYAQNDMAALSRDLDEYSVHELVQISYECARKSVDFNSTSIRRDLARIQSDVRDELKRRSTGKMEVVCTGWGVPHERRLLKTIDCPRDQDGQESTGMCCECEVYMRAQTAS